MEAARARARSSRKRSAPAPKGSCTTRRPPPAGVDEDDGEGVDHISALPDALLGEIITLLSTKDGFRTQILSHRWLDLWSSSPLNLDSNDICSSWFQRAQDKVDQVVSRVLSTHLGPGRRFCIRTSTLRGRYLAVDRWLGSPALDNLQEIELKLGCITPEQLVPASVFRFRSTLRVAHIGGCHIPEFIVQGLHFPVLQQLGLNDVTISEASLHTVIGGCPVLQSLLITDCVGFRCIRIDSLTLRGFGCEHTYDSGNSVPMDEIILHNAPCLERVLLGSFTGTRLLVVDAPKLHTVGISSTSENYKFVFCSQVIQGLPSDKLAMVLRTVKILLVDTMERSSLDKAIEFITCFPFLEKLYITGGRTTDSSNLWRRKHKDLIKRIDLSLKTIVLEFPMGFRGIKWEVNFVTFFVLNARQLESFTLWVPSIYYNEEFLEEQRRNLQVKDRASRAARFHFTTEKIMRIPLDLKNVHDLEIDPFVR